MIIVYVQYIDSRPGRADAHREESSPRRGCPRRGHYSASKMIYSFQFCRVHSAVLPIGSCDAATLPCDDVTRPFLCQSGIPRHLLLFIAVCECVFACVCVCVCVYE